jgi:hypothetical protein
VAEFYRAAARHTGPVDAGQRALAREFTTSMAGALNLAKVTSVTKRHGAHVRLIGNDRQLAAVEFGGALRLLEREVANRIATRLNDAMLRTGRGTDRVKNGDAWTVGKVQADGALSVTHVGHGGRITLLAEYVQKNVELGYASTIHRAQGMTATS